MLDYDQNITEIKLNIWPKKSNKTQNKQIFAMIVKI